MPPRSPAVRLPRPPPWAGPPILTPEVAGALLRARRDDRPVVATSLDLGLSQVEVPLTPPGAVVTPDLTVDWPTLERVTRAVIGNGAGRCFAVTADGVAEIEVFSQLTRRRYSLLATRSAPTMLVAGVQMHRTKDVDPWQDTRLKVATVAPLIGRVLDTATGLGYTAVAAAETADQVITVELDPAALAIARQNPWSQSLFANPRIEQRVGDCDLVVRELPAGAFGRIIHDPPVVHLAGQLYSLDFYRQLHRLLGRGGRLFHYLGDLASGLGGRVSRGVVRRLHEAGFSRVVPRAEAFGVVAYK